MCWWVVITASKCLRGQKRELLQLCCCFIIFCCTTDKQTGWLAGWLGCWLTDYCHIKLISRSFHSPVSTGPGSCSPHGGTSPATAAPEELLLPWKVLRELGCEGGHAAADSGWSCNPAASLQVVTAETQVCSSLTWWPVRAWNSTVSLFLLFIRQARFLHDSADLSADTKHPSFE